MSNLYLAHYGVKGMHWGVRRYQNLDGSYTSAGRKRYGFNDSKPYSSVKKRKGLSKRTKKALKVGLAVAGTAAVAYGVYRFSKSEKGKEIITKILERNNPPIDEVPKHTPNIKEMIEKARLVGTLPDSTPKNPATSLKVLQGGSKASSNNTNSGKLKLAVDSAKKSIDGASSNTKQKEFRPQDFKHILLMQIDADGNYVPGPKIPADGKAYAEAYAKAYSNGSMKEYKEKYDYIVKMLKHYGGTYYDNVKF